MANKLDILFQAQLARYQTVFDADHSIDSKNGVLIGGILAVSIFIYSSDIFNTDNKYIFAALVVGLFTQLAALAIAVINTGPKGYMLPSNTVKDFPEYLDFDSEELAKQLISDVECASGCIEKNLRMKALLFKIALYAFIISTIGLTIIRQLIG